MVNKRLTQIVTLASMLTVSVVNAYSGEGYDNPYTFDHFKNKIGEKTGCTNCHSVSDKMNLDEWATYDPKLLNGNGKAVKLGWDIANGKVLEQQKPTCPPVQNCDPKKSEMVENSVVPILTASRIKTKPQYNPGFVKEELPKPELVVAPLETPVVHNQTPLDIIITKQEYDTGFVKGELPKFEPAAIPVLSQDSAEYDHGFEVDSFDCKECHTVPNYKGLTTMGRSVKRLRGQLSEKAKPKIPVQRPADSKFLNSNGESIRSTISKSGKNGGGKKFVSQSPRINSLGEVIIYDSIITGNFLTDRPTEPFDGVKTENIDPTIQGVLIYAIEKGWQGLSCIKGDVNEQPYIACTDSGTENKISMYQLKNGDDKIHWKFWEAKLFFDSVKEVASTDFLDYLPTGITEVNVRTDNEVESYFETMFTKPYAFKREGQENVGNLQTIINFSEDSPGKEYHLQESEFEISLSDKNIPVERYGVGTLTSESYRGTWNVGNVANAILLENNNKLSGIVFTSNNYIGDNGRELSEHYPNVEYTSKGRLTLGAEVPSTILGGSDDQNGAVNTSSSSGKGVKGGGFVGGETEK